ncbi:MAG: hypothetical protein ACRD1X_10535 [Vicinamibacteria bacterium]
MSEYLRFARLAILLLILFLIGRLVVGATGVPYERGTGVFSLVTLSWILSFVFAAFSRPLRGYGWKKAVMLGATIVISAQLIIFAATVVSYLVGAETYFNHPAALNVPEPVGLVQALPIRLVGLIVNTIVGSIWASLGWWGGKLLPKTA